jgi:hypothetical protein
MGAVTFKGSACAYPVPWDGAPAPNGHMTDHGFSANHPAVLRAQAAFRELECATWTQGEHVLTDATSDLCLPSFPATPPPLPSTFCTADYFSGPDMGRDLVTEGIFSRDMEWVPAACDLLPLSSIRLPHLWPLLHKERIYLAGDSLIRNMHQRLVAHLRGRSNVFDLYFHSHGRYSLSETPAVRRHVTCCRNASACGDNATANSSPTGDFYLPTFHDKFGIAMNAPALFRFDAASPEADRPEDAVAFDEPLFSFETYGSQNSYLDDPESFHAAAAISPTTIVGGLLMHQPREADQQPPNRENASIRAFLRYTRPFRSLRTVVWILPPCEPPLEAIDPTRRFLLRPDHEHALSLARRTALLERLPLMRDTFRKRGVRFVAFDPCRWTTDPEAFMYNRTPDGIHFQCSTDPIVEGLPTERPRGFRSPITRDCRDRYNSNIWRYVLTAVWAFRQAELEAPLLLGGRHEPD